MNGYDTSDGYRLEPLDDRDEENPDYTIDPDMSSPDFQFSEEDPAAIEEPHYEARFEPRSKA